MDDQKNNVTQSRPETHGKTDIVQKIRELSQVSRADLPRDIDFSISNRVLNVFIKNAAQNMQTDASAFEGWVLIVKNWLDDEIEYVVLDFAERDDLMHRFGSTDACHYNRFLYRLFNMTRIFPSWFMVADDKRDTLAQFINRIQSGMFLRNHSLRERGDVLTSTRMERQIESWFVFHEGKDLLADRWKIDKTRLFNQLPTGVFYDYIAKDRAVFSRSASAIDIWGIGQDGQTLHLIELKCGDNKGIGVISELLFYTMLTYDTSIAQDALFTFGKYGKTPDSSDMAAIKNEGNRFTWLFSHILAETYHPLFSDAVESSIRTGLRTLDISFDRAIYSYSQKEIVDADYDL